MVLFPHFASGGLGRGWLRRGRPAGGRLPRDGPGPGRLARNPFPRLDHRPNSATGDHARAARGWLQHYIGGAEVADRLVRNGIFLHGHANEVLLRVLNALTDRVGNLVRLPEPHPNDAVAITDHDDRA